VTYVGRFAPSPTGPLHIGSLAAAVASFLDARQHSGEWLVRIEDIDPPREMPGAAAGILRTLERFDLQWDRSVLYQSSRLAAYRDAAAALLLAGRAFRCSCTRSELRDGSKGSGLRYPGTCRTRTRHQRPTAVRVRVDPGIQTMTDELQGGRSVDLGATSGDYVIVRRDGLPAYHLAVVVDDAAQGVTHVVRGLDLLEATFAHLHLQGALGLARPHYCHLPVIVNSLGQKLSKQSKAAAVDALDRSAAAGRVLGYLGAAPPRELVGAPPAVLWQWAIGCWSPAALRGRAALPETTGPDTAAG
jgi:glutamyl-Q tRNA(Asp) synthetase